MTSKKETVRMKDYSELVKRLHADTPFKICPYDKRSPEYRTTPDNEPCKYCGGLPEGPDRCTGGDTRIISEAADAITTLTARVEELEEALKPFGDDAAKWAHFDAWETLVEDWQDGPNPASELKVLHLRCARAALKVGDA